MKPFLYLAGVLLVGIAALIILNERQKFKFNPAEPKPKFINLTKNYRTNLVQPRIPLIVAPVIHANETTNSGDVQYSPELLANFERLAPGNELLIKRFAKSYTLYLSYRTNLSQLKAAQLNIAPDNTSQSAVEYMIMRGIKVRAYHNQIFSIASEFKLGKLDEAGAYTALDALDTEMAAL